MAGLTSVTIDGKEVLQINGVFSTVTATYLFTFLAILFGLLLWNVVLGEEVVVPLSRPNHVQHPTVVWFLLTFDDAERQDYVLRHLD